MNKFPSPTKNESSEELKKKCQIYRLSLQEHQKITELLGRPPQGVEWAIFSALWSEHCSYKSSKNHLRKFSYRNARVCEGEGENAGVVDIGYGEKIAFKMESHNHPSFIEPFQGAATGVGGILRDIFTMGARPIALADYLCFGEPQAPRMKKLVEGVVAGISSYGNCVGVPTVTGQTEFHSSYNNNILVNAMAVGLITEGMIMARSAAQGPGNWVVYVGAQTGKDGVHGASMASESFGENNEAKKPNVQIGDPFFEKLLIESCLEVLQQELVVAMQDMGAAGLTSSSFEMAAKSGLGMKLHLDHVPLRDSTMNPEEILLSESQERMLLICEPQKFAALQKVFHRWGLEAQKIGEVIPGSKIELHWHGEVLTEIDPRLVVDQAPRYERDFTPWNFPKKKSPLSTPPERKENLQIPTGEVLKQNLLANSKSLDFCSREWIYRQYDQRVGARTARDSRSSVAFLQLPSQRALAIAVGCRPSVMRMDASVGGMDAVFYPALQMAVKGAEAVAVTDCLNFGNPEKNPIMSEFVAAVEGIAAASKALDAPVVSGNVSFYNETQGQNITSTPATGLIGVRENLEGIPEDFFTGPGQSVYWVRAPQIKSVHTQTSSPQFEGELHLINTADWIRSLKKIVSEHPVVASRAVGRGGLLETLRRMSLGDFGFEALNPSFYDMSLSAATLESFYEAVLVVESHSRSAFEKVLAEIQPRSLNEFHCIGSTLPGVFQWGTARLNLEEIRKPQTETWTQILRSSSI